MPVDMVVSRFMEELRRAIPAPFEREGDSDPAIRESQLPPYRHVFHALCLLEHSSGYHLPSYENFKRAYLRALQDHHRYRAQLDRLMPGGEPAPGLLYRIGGWYLDGMAHTHLYCALVQAYEDQRRIGAVMMDARVDAKLKTDIAVVTPGAAVRVDIQFTQGRRQSALLAQRARAEATAKRNNAASSQIGNPFYEQVPCVTITRAEMKRDDRTGAPLFRPSEIDRLMREIDGHLGVPAGETISYADMRALTMADIQRGAAGRAAPV